MVILDRVFKFSGDYVQRFFADSSSSSVAWASEWVELQARLETPLFYQPRVS